MAQASNSKRNRPLSPHLQVWRWGPAMTVSILHRVSGNGLAFAGAAILLWWLGALASGPLAYADFQLHATAWYGQVVLVGISWAFFNHLTSGLRHLVLDVGAGFDVDTNNRWSTICIVIGVVLTAAFWAVIKLL